MQALIERLKSSWQERAIALKAASFAMVGVVNTIVDLSLFSFAYYFVGVPILAANTFAWVLSVSGSYVMNSRITFAPESGGRLGLKTFLTFIVAQAAGFVANSTTVLIASYFMPVLLGKILAVGASFVVNFSLSHFVVFRRR